MLFPVLLLLLLSLLLWFSCLLLPLLWLYIEIDAIAFITSDAHDDVDVSCRL